MKKIICFVLIFLFIGMTGILYSQNPIPPVQPGDVDESNEVDIIDALLVAQYYVGLDPEGLVNTSVADVDGNNVINIIDALLIAQFYVGLISEFPLYTPDFIISLDETLTITLSTAPSTGYGWFYTIEDPNVLYFESDGVINCGDLPGSPCEHNFVFRGINIGTTEILFEYYRDFDDPPVIADSITYSVQVR
jgi:predicted secreted protein